MTIYAVFDKDAREGPAGGPVRFSWFAALLPPLYALAHGLWLEFALYFVIRVLLCLACGVSWVAAALWVYVAFSAAIVF